MHHDRHEQIPLSLSVHHPHVSTDHQFLATTRLDSPLVYRKTHAQTYQ